jgi:UDP-N-acetylmuramyl pentapeptide phosphotransferase/UDP-N-acetylglucosamine-1-phosphate transferase
VIPMGDLGGYLIGLAFGLVALGLGISILSIILGYSYIAWYILLTLLIVISLCSTIFGLLFVGAVIHEWWVE